MSDNIEFDLQRGQKASARESQVALAPLWIEPVKESEPREGRTWDARKGQHEDALLGSETDGGGKGQKKNAREGHGAFAPSAVNQVDPVQAEIGERAIRSVPQRANENLPAPVIAELVQLGRQRQTLISFVNAQERRLDSYLAGAMCKGDWPAAGERKKLFERVKLLRQALEARFEAAEAAANAASAPGSNSLAAVAGRKEKAAQRRAEAAGEVEPIVADMVKGGWRSIRDWNATRDYVEHRMKEATAELPEGVTAYVDQVIGMSRLGLALLVAEAGDFSAYPKKGHLWKRLGLAVFENRSQGNAGPKATADDWIVRGYSRNRRSISWQVFDPMLRAQWCRDRGDTEGEPRARGEYGAYYAAIKRLYQVRNESGYYAERAAEELKRGKASKEATKLYAQGMLTAGHIDRRARRSTEKRLVRDIWRAWRRANIVVPEKATGASPGANYVAAQAAE